MQTIDLHGAGDTLRRMRERRGWTQRELGRLAGMSDATIRNLERGERHDEHPLSPERATIRRIAEAIGAPDGITLLEVYGLGDMVETTFAGGHFGDALDRLDPAKRRGIEEIVRILVDLVSDDATVTRLGDRVKPGYRSDAVGPTAYRFAAVS